MIYTVSNGSGGSPNVLIKTETGATVTLSKGDIVLTEIAENGEALFENVEYGTWTATATLNGQTSDSVSIEVKQEIETEVPLSTPISDLQVGAKLKIDGNKFILQAISPVDYPNCYTLISEDVIGTSIFNNNGSTAYENSVISQFCNDFYNELSSKVKEHIVPSNCFPSNHAVPNQLVFPPSAKQLNYTSGNGNNLGFSDNASRAIGTSYWTVSTGNRQDLALTVVGNGSFSNNGVAEAHGVRVLMNFDNTAFFSGIDSEGYYTIVGTDTISTLKDKSLKILGVEL